MSTIIQEIDTHFTDAVTTFYAAASAGITNYVMNIAWVVSYWLARVVVFLWSVKSKAIAGWLTKGMYALINIQKST